MKYNIKRFMNNLSSKMISAEIIKSKHIESNIVRPKIRNNE